VLGVSVHAWFSNDELSLAPGDTLTLPLTVHNLGDETESYTIVPAGLTASWTNITPGNLTLFGGSQDVIDVTISPPALSSTTAGPTSIAIRVIPLGDSDDAVVAEATLVIEPFDDCRIVPLQPIQRTRHRANFEFMVENHGNTVTSCRLHLIDSTDRVDGDFDPPAVGVGPGAATLVRLKARAARGGFRRATRTLDFEVEAGRFGCYRLPVVSHKWLDRLEWMEEAGERWWPVFGAVYFVVAVKRVRGMRLVGLAREQRQKAAASPAVAVNHNHETHKSRMGEETR